MGVGARGGEDGVGGDVSWFDLAVVIVCRHFLFVTASDTNRGRGREVIMARLSFFMLPVTGVW